MNVKQRGIFTTKQRAYLPVVFQINHMLQGVVS